jgi:hypothetical protein
MDNLSSGRRTISTALVVVALMASWNSGERAWAVGRNYILDASQSSITVSGTVDSQLGAGKPIQTQGPGSLTTSYTGTINTNRLTNSIQFLAGSAVDANVNGNWQPLADGGDGSAPADYGGKITGTVIIIFVPVPVTVNFAGRDFIFGMTSGALAVSSNQFDLSSTDVTFSSGSIAYRSSLGTPAGSESVVNQGGTLSGIGTLGTLSQGGLVYETLTVPTNTSFDIMADATTTIHLTLTGQLVGKSLIPVSDGDYNNNGRVDGADYVVWRNTNGQTGVGLAADGNGDSEVTTADFDLWRSKFGQAGIGSGSGELALSAAVPECSSLAMFLAAVAVGCVRRRWPR